MKRPRPPTKLVEFDPHGSFVRSRQVEKWLRATFLMPEGKLHNPDHEHLQESSVGVLWTNVDHRRRQREVVGQAEIPQPPTMVNAWAKARWRQQMRGFFGDVLPDFIITLSAPYSAQAEDYVFCALVEHELYHCAQKRDEFDCPKFRRDGKPVYGILGHDVEEFVGVVRRYGANAGGGAVAALVAAAREEPTIGAAQIAAACGTCGARLS